MNFDLASGATHNLPVSRLAEWIPEMARREPRRTLAVAYQVMSGTVPADVERTIIAALHASALGASREDASSWRVVLPWRTRVFALIPRDVDEVVTIQLVQRPDMWELIVRCRPTEVHGAHAAGFAGVIFVAASVWIASGLAAGMMPALSTMLAGGLLVEFTRQWAFDALTERLRGLAWEAGSALWPGIPAQIIDISTP